MFPLYWPGKLSYAQHGNKVELQGQPFGRLAFKDRLAVSSCTRSLSKEALEQVNGTSSPLEKLTHSPDRQPLPLLYSSAAGSRRPTVPRTNLQSEVSLEVRSNTRLPAGTWCIASAIAYSSLPVGGLTSPRSHGRCDWVGLRLLRLALEGRPNSGSGRKKWDLRPTSDHYASHGSDALAADAP